MFVDADDLLVNTCIQGRLEVFRSAMACNFVVFGMGVFKHTIGDDNRNWLPNSQSALIDFLQHKLPWSIIQPLWRTEFVKKTGGFDVTFERLQDVEFHTRILLNPTVKYKCISKVVDCFYRISEERKVYRKFEFLAKMARSISKYESKMALQVENDLIKYLMGTRFEGLLQFTYYYRVKAISNFELEELLILMDGGRKISKLSRIVYLLAKFYNKQNLRIPGINRFLKKLLIVCS
jgi:hypothetical protein